MLNFNNHLQELRSFIIGMVLLLATTVIGLVWIGIGIYSFLVSLIGAVWGPVLLGFIFILPLLIFAVVKLFNPRESQHELSSAYANPYADTSMNINKMIDSLSGQSPLVVTIVAITAGFLATRFPAILSLFTQVVSAYADDLKARAEKDAAIKAAAEQAVRNAQGSGDI